MELDLSGEVLTITQLSLRLECDLMVMQLSTGPKKGKWTAKLVGSKPELLGESESMAGAVVDLVSSLESKEITTPKFKVSLPKKIWM